MADSVSGPRGQASSTRRSGARHPPWFQVVGSRGLGSYHALLCFGPCRGQWGGTFSQNPGLGDPPPTPGPPGAGTASSVSSSAAVEAGGLSGASPEDGLAPGVRPVLTVGTCGTWWGWGWSLSPRPLGCIGEGLLPGRLAEADTMNPLLAAPASSPGACLGPKENMDCGQCPCP